MTIPMATLVSADEYKDILNNFFLGVSPDLSYIPDPSLEDYILAACLSNGVANEKANQISKHGASVAQQFYPLHKFEIQRLVGLFSAYFFAVDDLGLDFVDDIRKFGRKTMQGDPQPPLLEAFAALLPQFNQHYPDICSNKIATGLINFMDASAIEFETTGKFLHLETAASFPRYFRIMTGLAEPYTFFILTNDLWSEENINLFIQAAPDIMDLTDTINDLLSFYKESIVGDERNNYVYHRALSDCIRVSDVLHRLVEENTARIDNVKATVSESPALLQMVDAYIRGFVGFHVMRPRYKLNELEIPSLRNIIDQRMTKGI
ncbi:hypothetical protein N7517_007430 [Penicillium concentricum]|uniref:Terpenoid synthase n=1 Tax=Penicillium concentricum TaxID=293559 RepID=A0A9W9SDW6_9EURO|nr:uncharacterized protein N7517_007430 [Penicillium concentricum]KAJ5375424.1 hypothetical protein N7517_007430 [Penicillium concentricum]